MKTQSEVNEVMRDLVEERKRQEEAVRPKQRLIFWSVMIIFTVLMLGASDSVRQYIGL